MATMPDPKENSNQLPDGQLRNLFSDLPDQGDAEQFESLIAGRSFRVERIVSQGHASPPGFWYDQPEDEWVVVLRGEATLRFEDETEPRRMKPGDHVHIAAHRKHRVDWTISDGPTIWLAIHFDP